MMLWTSSEREAALTRGLETGTVKEYWFCCGVGEYRGGSVENSCLITATGEAALSNLKTVQVHYVMILVPDIPLVYCKYVNMQGKVC